MINDETKAKLITELEKNGNVYVACMKTNIHRSSFYRWKEEDKEFKKRADKSERIGRMNNCDIAELSLMMRVKEKDLGAIKYLLGHNHPVYKPKRTDKGVTNVFHKRDLPKKQEEETAKRYNQAEQEMLQEYCDKMEERYQATGELPKGYKLDPEEEAHMQRTALFIRQYEDEK
jgi:hypothetical protein